jgi:hypothetical protein
MQWFIIFGCINGIRHGSTPSSEEQILNAVIWDSKHRVNFKGRFSDVAHEGP